MLNLTQLQSLTLHSCTIFPALVLVLVEPVLVSQAAVEKTKETDVAH